MLKDKPSFLEQLMAGDSEGTKPPEPLALFDAAQPAEERCPLPQATYAVVAILGGLITARSGTPGYEVVFRVCEGPHAGRRVWKSFYLTPAAMSFTKRDMAKFGLTTAASLEQPFPAHRFACRLDVVVRTGDDGRTWNEVRAVRDVIRREIPADPFAPATEGNPC